MMGNSVNGVTPAAASGRPRAAEVARLDSILTHVLVSPEHGEGVQVFRNARPLPPGALESLTLTITAPDDAGKNGGITGILSFYPPETPSEGGGEAAVGGRPAQQGQSLFPGTVEVIAKGRRIIVTCIEEGSFDGLWLGLGLRDDGTSSELSGVRSLHVVVTPTLLDARLVWAEDGTEEDLLPDG